MADEQTTPLQAAQKHFALLTMAGQYLLVDRGQIAAVARGERSAEVSFFKGRDAEIHLSRFLEKLPVPSGRNVQREFYTSPSTHVYNRIAFSPRDEGPNTINYWCPHTAPAAPGDWSIIKDFLLKIICASNQATFAYLTRFMAHMLQVPWEKPGIMIVLLGGQGTGKGTFFNLLSAIWGRTTLRVSDVQQVLGQYNAALERHYLVCMDEALFNGDKKAMEKLKSLITEPVLHVEQKYEPPRNIDSVHRLFAVSNQDHFGNIEIDDRRMLVLRISDERRQDLAYFGALAQAIADPRAVGAMVHDLLQIDLSGFQVRERPRTGELALQKLQSLAGFDRYWYEVLFTGRFDHASTLAFHGRWTDATFVPTEVLLQGWREHDHRAMRFQAPQSNAIRPKMERLCPSASYGRPQIKGEQHRGFHLPSIQTARRNFEAHIGSVLVWDEPAEDDTLDPAAKDAADQLLASVAREGRGGT